jgi:uncharacterized protein (DUF3084 family)
VAEREVNVAAREDASSVKVGELKAKEDALDEREDALSRTSSDFDAFRAKETERLEAEAREQARVASETNAALLSRSKDLDDREAQINDRASAINDSEAHLTSREQAVIKREEAVTEAEQTYRERVKQEFNKKLGKL